MDVVDFNTLAHIPEAVWFNVFLSFHCGNHLGRGDLLTKENGGGADLRCLRLVWE